MQTHRLFGTEAEEHVACTAFGNGKIGIVGDFCMDVYWHADMTRSLLSRETPRFPLPVVREEFFGGAAANVAAM